MFDTHELVLDDFSRFLELAHIYHAECEPEVSFDEQRLLTNMFAATDRVPRDKLNGWVCYRNKQMIGLSIGSISSGFYTSELQADLHYWYVLPEFRSTRAALDLLRKFEKWAREYGAIRMHVGAERFDAEKAESINHLISKLGFTKYGEQFYKRIK